MDSVKSISAQLFQGNILVQEFGQEESSGNTLENGSSKSNETSSGSNFGVSVPIIAADMNNTSKSTDEVSEVTIEEVIRKDNEVLKIALDEFLINKVEHDLSKRKLIKEPMEASEFDFIVTENKYDFYDFKLLKSVVDYEKLLPFLNFNEEYNHIEDFEDIYSEYKKLYKDNIKDKTSAEIKAKNKNKNNKKNIDKFLDLAEQNIFKLIEFISDHINSIVQNKILLVSNDKKLIVFCDKNNLKYSSISLSLSENLNLKVFGQITSIRILEPEESILKNEQLEVDEVMSKPISFIFELYLAEFLKLEKGTEYRIIHPLSIETI